MCHEDGYNKLKISVIKYSCKVNFIGKQVDKNASSITHVIFDIDMECTGVQCVNSICVRMCVHVFMQVL